MAERSLEGAIDRDNVVWEIFGKSRKFLLEHTRQRFFTTGGLSRCSAATSGAKGMWIGSPLPITDKFLVAPSTRGFLPPMAESSCVAGTMLVNAMFPRLMMHLFCLWRLGRIRKAATRKCHVVNATQCFFATMEQQLPSGITIMVNATYLQLQQASTTRRFLPERVTPCSFAAMAESLNVAGAVAGQGRTGQGRTGQGRAGQGKAGQDRAGQGRTGQGGARQCLFKGRSKSPC